jgi:outer membrane protein
MSYRSRGRWLAVTLIAGVASAAFAIPASAQTLADAIALAYQSNPTLQAQRATQRALDENFVQARTGWRPTVTFSGSLTYVEDRVPRAARNPSVDINGDGVPDGVSYSRSNGAGLTFSQPLWTGGRTAAAVSAAQADILSGRENLRRVESQVVLSVIQAYADVRRDTEALRIQTENVAVLQRQLLESQARFEVGEITRTDVAQSQARLALAQAQLQSAQAVLASSRATYAAVVGQNPADLAAEPSLAYLLPTNVDEAFTVAEQNSPLLRGQQYAEEASRARVQGARAERMPTLSLQAASRYSAAGDDFQRDLYGRESTVGLNVTAPLFTGGLTSSRIRQAVERNNADKITIEQQRRSVLQTVTQSWNTLTASRANITSTAEQARASAVAAEGTRQEQQVGLRTTLDVLNAEQELRSAQLNQVNARRDEYVSAANVIAAMGRLEAKNLTPTIAQYDPKTNFRPLRTAIGWVPWEEAVEVVDRAATIAPTVAPTEKPVEAAIGPGLQQPSTPASDTTPPASTPRR